MPRRAAYHVHWSSETHQYEIQFHHAPAPDLPVPGSHGWFDWLEEIGSFAFSSRAETHFTALKERVQRGSSYWYGYRSRSGRTVKRYLGRTQDLSLARLEEVAVLLADEAPAPPRMKEMLPSQPAQALQSPSDTQMVLLASKLRPPHLPASLIERSKLFALLETSFLHPLTLLQAPAGFGKTTLVAQWIANSALDDTFPIVGWVSLDASDNDPLRFWRYVISACRAQQSSLGTSALALLATPSPSPFTMPPLETALTLLLNDLVEMQHPQILVLDDYHVIVEPAIHETLTFFLDHLPAACHVLLLSRAEPPFPLLRWRAQDALAELHMADLRFSPEETATFLHQTMPITISDEAITRLGAVLEGWAAGLRLLSLALQGRRTTQEVEASLRSLSPFSALSDPPLLPQSLLDYFVTEVLHTQPEALQRFLLQTSRLAYLSGPLCNAVTGREESAMLLATMQRAGLFLELLDEADPLGPWYRFHGLWAEALRREASRVLSAEEMSALSERASLWYEQHALIAEAIETALQANDAPRAALLIEQSTTDGHQWNPPTLLRWLSQLSDEVLSLHPGLSLLFAILLRFPQSGADTTLSEETWERIEAMLQMAEKRWSGQSNLTWLGGLYAFRALSVLTQGAFTRAVEYARQAFLWLPNSNNDYKNTKRPEIQVWRGISLLILGLKNVREGHLGHAQQLLQEAYTCSLAAGDERWHFTCETLLLLGTSSTSRGELHQAAEYYRQAQALASEQGRHEDAASALLGLAWLSFEWNNLTTAEQQAQEALEMVCQRELRLSDQATFQLALLQHVQGQTIPAQQQLAALLTHQQTASTPWTTWLYFDILSWQIRLQLTTGDLPAAQRNLSLLTRNTHEPDGAQRVSIQILQTRLLLARGNAHEARQQLEALLSLTREQWQIRNALEIQVLLALAYTASHQKQEALHWLSQTLREAQSENFIRLFLTEGEPLARLMVPIQERGLRSYVRTILHAFAPQSEASMSRTTSLLKEPLSPQEQRVLQLVISGRTNAQIARELVISTNTVKYHIKQLYRKLEVSNRLEASEAAHRLNLF